MTSPLRLVETRPGDDLFPGFCAVWSAGELLDRPDDPPRPASDHEALGRPLVEPGGSRDGTHRAALLGEQVVGALRLILPTKDNPRMAVVDVAVHPEHRRCGIGTLLLDEAVRLARENGRTQLIAELDEPVADVAGRAFALRHGWTCDLVETRRDLVLPLDEQRLSILEAEARQASRGYEVVTWRDRTPDALVEDRALLERRLTTDAPHGDLPFEEEEWDAARVREYEVMHVARGRTVLSAGAVQDGRMVAFTDLHVVVAQPQRAHQGGTLVLSEHRGHRLGLLVKAAALRQVTAAHPEVRRVTTYNSDSNTPMVAVNEALGFSPVGRLSSWSQQL